MDKKLRFGDLVRNSGRPQIITLWTEPGKNNALTRAIKGNRLLTIIQQPGKRDYGRIGFQMQPGASFLLFPRALPKEPDARVVGVNYQLVEEPAVADPIRPEHTKSSRPAKAKPDRRSGNPRCRGTQCVFARQPPLRRSWMSRRPIKRQRKSRRLIG